MSTQVDAPELGYLVSGQGNAFDMDQETTPELRWPNSIQVFDKMRRTDSQVTSVLRAVTLPLKRTTWRLDPNGASDDVVGFVARELNLPVVGRAATPSARTRGRFSWTEHLNQALLAMPLGFMPFEQSYRIGDDGLAHLRKLAPRPPASVQEIKVARDGGLEWIQQMRDPSTPPGVELKMPVSSLVVYVCDKEDGNWLGNSILRSCYAPWMIKQAMLRLAPQVVERNGMGVPVVEAPAGATDEELEKGRKMASSFRAGPHAGMSLPAGWKFTLAGVAGQLTDPMPLINYCDAQIGRSVLAHFLNLDGKGGSYALADTQADLFIQSLQTRADWIRDVANAHIIEDLVDINFGEDTPAPRLVFDEIGARHPATAAALAQLTQMGLLYPDRELEEFLRQMHGLPPKDPKTSSAPEPEPLPEPVAAPKPAPSPDGEPVALSASARRRRRRQAARKEAACPT
ncbi:DUF935 domain-containing protein [Rhodococcus pyridinivorans]|uniref:DUF935 domain-containing protein n=1 Tax=Rhodococcus pyridinivorans TaxID=103816 RepID=UPI0021647E16|nr:DUF935 domain-containing protein [Rhodococcus pyridinivorans]UVT24965.1 DUF935 domain-containing protein [Rhodococcus pyridinivorans]